MDQNSEQVSSDFESIEDSHAFDEKDGKIINILLVGRSGSGKTTLTKMLQKKNYQIVSTTGYSDTKQPTCHHCLIQNKKSNELYRMNVLDIPGLNEHRFNERENRSDAFLLDEALRFIESNVTFLNAVCFVTKAGDTYEHDLAIFRKFMDILGDKMKPISMIILTHAEQYPEHRIEAFMNDIRTHRETTRLVAYCKVGIFPSGVINSDQYDDLEENAKSKAQDKLQRKISIMKNKLVKALIPLADRPVKIDHLKQRRKTGEYQTGSENVEKKCCCTLL